MWSRYSEEYQTQCGTCHHFRKTTIDVEMGPALSCTMTIAPAFPRTKIDIFEPLKAYYLQNKRSTIKIWLVLFFLMATASTSVKVMKDYSTFALVQPFTDFACEVEYP